MRVGIVARPEIPGVLNLVRKVLGLLAKEEVLLEQKLARKLGKRGAAAQTLRKADAIVTIGGDGTVLFAQQLAPGVPTLGINIGGRGFLAEVKPGDAQRALRMLVVGKLPIIERERLAGEVTGKRLPDALNDAVVCTAKLGKTLSLRVSVDGKVAMDMRGDGVIVATTTGSTAYALAAGGSAVDPRLPAFVVVPVCPSHPRVHPLIVPIDSRIEVKSTRPEREGLVIVDGRLAAKIRYGAKLAFYRSPKPARFFGWGEFYRKLREKL